MTIDNMTNVNDDGTLQDAQRMTPAQPQAPTVPTVQPQQDTSYANQTLQAPAAPNAPQTPSAASNPNQPHWLARSLDAVLKAGTGGPVTFIDVNGKTQVQPQSRATLGKTLIAATLAGLLAKDEYRQTEYGPVRDYAGSGANAMAASGQVIDKMRAAPQVKSDAEQARRLMTLQANAELYKTMSASALQQHQTLTAQIESNQPLLKNVDEYESQRTPDQEAARGGQHLSKEDAEAQLKGKYTTWTALPDGTESVLNQVTGQVEDHPTYTILNPNAKVKLSPEAAGILSSTNSSWDNIHKVVGGDVTVPLSIAISANHEVMAIHTVQQFADDISKELGTKPADVMAAVKKNRQLLPAIDSTRDQIAAGGSLWRTLDAARNAKNGMDFLNLLGVSREQAQGYIAKKHNDEVAAAELAKDKAKTEAKGQKMESENDARAILANDSIVVGDPRKTWATKYLAIVDKQKQDQEQTAQNIKNGSPDDAGELLVKGIVSPSQIVSARNPSFAQQAYKAANRLDSSWTAPVAEARFKTASAPANLAFFGSADSLVSQNGTLNQLQEQHAKLPNGQLPAINGIVNWATHEIGGQAPTGFLATALGVADDYAKVMGGGQGSDTSRQQVLDSIMGSQNKDQMVQTVQAMKNAVNSQIQSRIGSNPYMTTMYGSHAPNAEAPKVPTTPKASTGKNQPQEQPVYIGGKLAGYTTDGKTFSRKVQ
jgi:hypothetical protein